MITMILKKIENGRWINVDASELYSVGDRFKAKDGKTYEVKSINRSKVNIEVVEDDEV